MSLSFSGMAIKKTEIEPQTLLACVIRARSAAHLMVQIVLFWW